MSRPTKRQPPQEGDLLDDGMVEFPAFAIDAVAPPLPNSHARVRTGTRSSSASSSQRGERAAAEADHSADEPTGLNKSRDQGGDKAESMRERLERWQRERGRTPASSAASRQHGHAPDPAAGGSSSSVRRSTDRTASSRRASTLVTPGSAAQTPRVRTKAAPASRRSTRSDSSRSSATRPTPQQPRPHSLTLSQGDSHSLPPQRDSHSFPPQRDSDSLPPQRDSLPVSLPRRDSSDTQPTLRQPSRQTLQTQTSPPAVSYENDDAPVSSLFAAHESVFATEGEFTELAGAHATPVYKQRSSMRAHRKSTHPVGPHTSRHGVPPPSAPLAAHAALQSTPQSYGGGGRHAAPSLELDRTQDSAPHVNSSDAPSNGQRTSSVRSAARRPPTTSGRRQRATHPASAATPTYRSSTVARTAGSSRRGHSATSTATDVQQNTPSYARETGVSASRTSTVSSSRQSSSRRSSSRRSSSRRSSSRRVDSTPQHAHAPRASVAAVTPVYSRATAASSSSSSFSVTERASGTVGVRRSSSASAAHTPGTTLRKRSYVSATRTPGTTLRKDSSGSTARTPGTALSRRASSSTARTPGTALRSTSSSVARTPGSALRSRSSASASRTPGAGLRSAAAAATTTGPPTRAATHLHHERQRRSTGTSSQHGAALASLSLGENAQVEQTRLVQWAFANALLDEHSHRRRQSASAQLLALQQRRAETLEQAESAERRLIRLRSRMAIHAELDQQEAAVCQWPCASAARHLDQVAATHRRLHDALESTTHRLPAEHLSVASLEREQLLAHFLVVRQTAESLRTVTTELDEFCEFAQQLHRLATIANEEQTTVEHCERLLAELCTLKDRENSYKLPELTSALAQVPVAGGPHLSSVARQALSYDVFAE